MALSFFLVAVYLINKRIFKINYICYNYIIKHFERGQSRKGIKEILLAISVSLSSLPIKKYHK